MTRVLIAFDKFKDALTAQKACEAAARGLRVEHPDWQLDLCPLTDGGEGFVETLTDAAGGRYETSSVMGPRGARVNARIGYVSGRQLTAGVRRRLQLGTDSSLAVIGLASTSGLELLSRNERDPWHTTTLGTGELIRVASDRKVDAILLGVGGSATNDLGLGVLAALGLRCSKADGSTVAVPTPATWPDIVSLHIDVELPPIFIACDVTNPLLGPRGATATFGPQKGLPAGDMPRLETAMVRMAGLLCDACGQSRAIAEVPGTGAAGGIAFGLMVATNAKVVSGFDVVSDWLDLPARIAAADLVLTGEGGFDATSLGGKGPGSILATARRLGKPAYLFAGSLNLPENVPELEGVTLRAITPTTMELSEALPRTAELLTEAITQLF